MQCPACHTVLQLAERQGVEIDYCPQCRGVWLDRGELDKLIERSAVASAASPGAGRSNAYERDDDFSEHDQARSQHRTPRRKSFLGELFDFD